MKLTVLHVSLFQYVYYHLLYIAICQPSCGSNEQCISPNTCQSINGWTGPTCDIRTICSTTTFGIRKLCNILHVLIVE